MRVCHVGNMANDGYATVSALREAGVDAELIIDANDFGMGLPQWEMYDVEGDPYRKQLWSDYPLPEWIRTWGSANRNLGLRLSELHRMTREYDLLHLHFPTCAWLQHTEKPYLAYEAGFIRQFGDGLTWTRFGEAGYRGSRCVTWTNTDTIDMVHKQHFPREEFVPFAIDTKRYTSTAAEDHDGPLRFLHPARQVWDVKGNDRLLRAFTRYVGEGGDATLMLVDWGYAEDAAEAHELLRPVSDHVHWVPPMSKPKLIQAYQWADAVFDQFILPGSGTTGYEAMSCGVPLVIHFNGTAERCYGESPPRVDAQTEDQILDAMHRLGDVGYRRRVGEHERRFVEKHLSYPVVARRLKALYEEVLG